MFTSIVHTIIFILFTSLVNLTLAQETAPTCLQLEKNNICGPDFEGFPILKTPQLFTTLEQFDRYIEDRFANNTKLADTFHTTHGCHLNILPEAVNSLRYQKTFWCSNIVKDALDKGCRSNSNKSVNQALICKPVCDVFSKSIDTVLRNSTVCPSNAQKQPVRDDLLNKIALFCKGSAIEPVSNRPTACFSHSIDDQNNCGFLSITEAFTKCESLPNDQCCADLMKSKKGEIVMGLNLGTVASISLGVLALLASLIILIGRKKRRIRKNGDDTQSKKLKPNNQQQNTYPDPPAYDFSGSGEDKLAYFNSARTTAVPMEAILISKINHNEQGPGTAYSYNSSQSPASQKFNHLPSPSKANVKDDGSSSLLNSPSINLDFFSKGKKYRVIHEYETSAGDELKLIIGQEIMVSKEFDDGWAVGKNIMTNEYGAFPMVCLESVIELNNRNLLKPRNGQEPRISQRFSSYNYEK